MLGERPLGMNGDSGWVDNFGRMALRNRMGERPLGSNGDGRVAFGDVKGRMALRNLMGERPLGWNGDERVAFGVVYERVALEDVDGRTPAYNESCGSSWNSWLPVMSKSVRARGDLTRPVC